MGDLKTSLTISLVNQVTKPLRQVSQSIAGITTDAKKLNRAMQSNLDQRAAMRGQLLDVVALGATLAAPLKVAIDFESAMADIGKVVNFKNPDGLKNMGREIKNMSRDIPISATGLASIVAAGGQLGIAEQKLAPFARTAAKMSVAFDMLPAQSGDAMAKLSNVFNMPIGSVELLGDAINHLSDNTAAKAPELVNALLRVGGTAKLFGLSAVQTSALADAFIALGKPPEVAGTAINAMLLKLQTASTQGKAFQSTLKHMGLSAKGLEKAIGKDAQGALLGFLESLEKLNKGDQAKAAKLLFGQEYSDDITLLVGSLDKYRQALKLTADETQYAGSMTKEFQNRSKTTANALKLLSNGIMGIGINIGSTLLPGLNSIVGVMHSATGSIAEFTEQFPLLTKIVSTLTATLIVGKVATIGLGFAFTFLKGGAFSLVKGLQTVVAALRIVRLAMIANPIGAFVSIMASAAILIVSNWGKVTGFFTNLWDEVKLGFDQGFVQGIWTLLKNFNPVYLLSEGVNGLIQYLTGIDLGSIGAGMIESLYAGIRNTAQNILPNGFLQTMGFGSPAPAMASPVRSVNSQNSAFKPEQESPSRAEVSVRFDNLPPGAKITNLKSDRGVNLDVDAGLVMAGP
ncbi:MAG: phage tail tape measure protein [Rhodospirillales bacterium]|nr:phage tail tape measure protein [Rhodospirillales bacterium]